MNDSPEDISAGRGDPPNGQPVRGDGRRVLIKVRGIVQGVGFRPFVYQLAATLCLGGWVRNRESGVEIEISGPAAAVEQFILEIPRKAPPLSKIVSIESNELEFEPANDFRILTSSSNQARSTLISPDVCTCPDCLRELFDPEDRRFRYPFTNCTNCGPRYTIIKDIPYDRKNTTMASFGMCPECAAEYENPLDRRFHAQPNACWKCGPRVWLEDSAGNRVSETDDAIRKTVHLLDGGAVVAIKGLGGFHLAAKATDEAAVELLRGRKIREEKPFAVMFSSIEEIKRYCLVGDSEEELLLSPSRPIVLLPRTEQTCRDKLGEDELAGGVAPKNRYLGAFLPYTPLHFLLFDAAPYRSLVMTSGNRSDEPIVMDNPEAASRLKGIADYYLLHDRDIYMRCDDSVTRVLSGKTRPMRRARGFVPVPVFLDQPGSSVLGTGAELKNTICLTRRNEAFLSQHIGDLENLETMRSFEHAIDHLERLLEISPELIIHDLHPDYLSTQWALRQNLPKMAVQHHHAHIASVMAEHHLDRPLIGLALDGTGLGTDGTIWGGEVLMVDRTGFERLGHFRHVLLPGGEKAIKEPWRMALSYLWGIDPIAAEVRFADLMEKWPDRKLVLQMLSKGINSPATSSCGRLFDAVAALCGVRESVNYEGQAAIELEQAIEPDGSFYEGEITERESKPFILDPFPMIMGVVWDVRQGIPAGKISARFHNGIVRLLTKAAVIAASKCGIRQIALSGGVFQNAFLSARLEKELTGLGFEVYSNEKVPANDACISLGQAFVGSNTLLARR